MPPLLHTFPARRDKQQAEERSLVAVDELFQEKQQHHEEAAAVGKQTAPRIFVELDVDSCSTIL